MFPEIMTFFTNNANGIMYLMLFFIVILFVFSYLSLPANKNGKNGSMNNPFLSSYGKNIIFSFFFIIIVLFLFSLLGYSSAFSTSSSSSSQTNGSPSFIEWITGTGLFTFFSANGLSILNVVIIFLMFIVLFSMVGVNFNPPKNRKVQKVVEIEGFSCNLADPPENEKQCNYLSKTNCISTSCCGWLNGEKCVSSDLHHRNPNFLSDAQGNKIIVKTWCTSASCNE